MVADQLGTEYTNTIYSAQSKLALARMYLDKNRDQDAADALRELIDGDAGEELKQVGRLRLARILLYQDKPQEVVDLLQGQDDPAFAAAFGELLGDAYYALDRIEDAQLAYQAALLDPLSQGTVDEQLLQWKVLDLPEIETAESGTESPPAEAAESSDESAAGSSPDTTAEASDEGAAESPADEALESAEPDVVDEGTE